MLTAADAKAIANIVSGVSNNQGLPELLKSLDDAYSKIEEAAYKGQRKVVIYPTQFRDSHKSDMKIALVGLGYSVDLEIGGDITIKW